MTKAGFMKDFMVVRSGAITYMTVTNEFPRDIRLPLLLDMVHDDDDDVL